MEVSAFVLPGARRPRSKIKLELIHLDQWFQYLLCITQDNIPRFPESMLPLESAYPCLRRIENIFAIGNASVRDHRRFAVSKGGS